VGVHQGVLREGSRPAYQDARLATHAAAGVDGDLDRRGRRRETREGQAGPAGCDRRGETQRCDPHPLSPGRLAGEGSIDAASRTMKVRAAQQHLDVVVVQPQLVQLLPGDDAVL
jgi:hypothetical protein